MNSSDWISLLAVAEFALLVTIVLAALIAWLVVRRRRDAAAAADLIAKVRLGELEHRAALRKRLVESGLPEHDATEAVQRLLDVEYRFYEQCLTDYLDHDTDGVRHLNERLMAVISSYLTLERPAAAAAAESSAAADRGPEIERLKQAVRNLSEEMGLYRETLNRVFSEYTAMFGVHLDAKLQLTAKEILDRLESGQFSGEQAIEADAASDEPPPEQR